MQLPDLRYLAPRQHLASGEWLSHKISWPAALRVGTSG